jgi:predicted phosphoribosyltransferase
VIPEPIFRNRSHAGSWLAEHLRRFRGPETVVLGIPRGGVIVAAEIARSLGAKLDVAIARKLPAPGQPEVAIGAVTPAGGLFLDAEAIHWLGVGDPYLRGVIARERAEAERRERAFRATVPAESITGKVAIVVDDGLATGATMRAAVRALRQATPRRLIVAAPVGSPEACHALRSEADEVVCPVEVPDFGAVGRFYENFTQTSDAEVLDALEQSQHGPVAGAGRVV